MRARILVPVISVALLIPLGCGKEEVPLYTAGQFLQTTTIFGGSFSHDEQRLLVSSDASGVFNAYAIPVAGGEAEQLTHSTDNAIFAVSFFPHDNRILYSTDQAGNEIAHLHLRKEDGTVTDLTPEPEARAVFFDWTRDEEHLLFGSNKRDPQFVDVYLMDIATFTPKMIYLNDAGYHFGAISDDLRYLAFSKGTSNRNDDMYLYDRETGEVTKITPHEGDIRFQPLEFSRDSGSLFFLTDQDREFMYLRRYDLATGQSETIETADWDIYSVRFSHNDRYRVTAINSDARTEIRIYDNEAGTQLELPNLPDGHITSLKISKSESLMRFYVTDSRSPRNLYVYDIATDEHRRLTDALNPAIDPDHLVDAEIVRFPSFDGLEIPALLYKPHGASKDQPVPALVSVPGGPGGQMRIGYGSQIQHLVNHGYAILAINNRGASGYGKTFNQLDDLRHGEDDLADCIAGKEFLAAQEWIDGEQVGIMGGSYGGYMVLAALTFQPEAFAAGVDMFGISNWLRTLRSIPPWWESIRADLYTEMGDPETDEEYLRRISPLFHAENVVRPLIVLQGANDPRVLKVESDEIVAAAKANGVPVEYLVFDDEGHGFLKRENEIQAQEAILVFLERYLKGITTTEAS